MLDVRGQGAVARARGEARPSGTSPARDGWAAWWPALGIALAWALGIRVAALLVATGSRWMFQQGSTGPRPLGTWLSVWDRWDAANLVEIAEHGYLSDTEDPSYPGSATAFFPGFPLAVRAVGALLGGELRIAALVVSLLASVVAFAALYRLAEERAGQGTGQLAVALLACSPVGVFLVAGYTEALFLAGAIPAWYFASHDRWELAGLAGAVAVATRTVGVLLVAGIAVDYLHRRGVLRFPALRRLALADRLRKLAHRARGAVSGTGGTPSGSPDRKANGKASGTATAKSDGKAATARKPKPAARNGTAPRPSAGPPRRAALGLGIALAPLMAWMTWLYWRAGDPLQFVVDQRTGWGRKLTGPVEAFETTVRGALGQADTTWVFTWRLELVGAAIGLTLLAWCLLRREWGWSVYVGLTMTTYLLSTWYFSIPRGLLGLFPLPLLLARALRGHPQAFAVALAISASMFSLGVAVFVRGPWVG